LIVSLDDLRKRLVFRCQRIDANLDAIRACLPSNMDAPSPSPKDLAAMTFWVGGIYNEIEEVLKGVAGHFGDAVPQSGAWHRDLLDQLAKPTARRAAVLTLPLRQRLDDLRAFRHFARNATVADPDWQRLQPLVDGLDATTMTFRRELIDFLANA
jgi:hypothetical protein